MMILKMLFSSNESSFRTHNSKRTKRRNPKDAEGPREVEGNPIQIQSGSETVENFVLPDGGQPVTLKFHKTTFKPSFKQEEIIDDIDGDLAQETPVVIQVDEPLGFMKDKKVETSLPPLKTSSSFVRLPGYHIPPQSPPPPPPPPATPPLSPLPPPPPPPTVPLRRPRLAPRLKQRQRPRKNPVRRKPGAVAGAPPGPGRRRRKKNLKERLSDLRKSLF